MAKIAFFNIPAHGHTNPTLPVVQELIQRGHEVLYYSSEEMRSKITATGVDFRAYPEPMPSTKEIAQKMKAMIDASLTLIGLSEHLTAWTVAEMRHEQPDLIVYDTTAMWAYIAARKLNIPRICSITHFVLDGSQGQIPMSSLLRYIVSTIPHLPRIARWKRKMTDEFGKENVGGITEYAPLNIVYTSEEFHPPNKRIDDTFRFVGPSINAATRDGEFDFGELGDGKIIYISLGTINYLDTDFYHAAFEAFGNYPAQFVLSVGQNSDISALGDIPANFIVKHYVPQLDILQHVDVFITHGGMNSVHEGLYYGVPEIVVPHQMEQLMNGIRVKNVGAGILLGDKAPYGRVTAKELHEALDKILSDDSYRQKAAYYGKSLKDAGGYLKAVGLIEEFVGVPELEYA